MPSALLVVTPSGETVFSLEELARACDVAPDWVLERVADGVLEVSLELGLASVRFDSVTLVRARRVLQLERSFEADPQLAALTVDLIEEVGRLRRQLRGSA